MNLPTCRLKNRKFYIYPHASLIKMILEEVRPHPYRDDIYINVVITPYNDITISAKKLVNQILIKEVARNGLKIAT